MKKKFIKLGVISFIIAICVFVLDYFMFHFLTSAGTLSTTFHKEAQKPLVTYMVAIFGVLMFTVSIVSMLIAKIFYSNEKKEEVW